MIPRWLLAALLVLGSVGTAHAQYGMAPNSDPPDRPLPDVGLDQRLGEPVSLDLTFQDEHGQPLRLADCVAGKPTVLVLAYYRCPQLCTQVLNGLVDALRDPQFGFSVGEQFNVVTVSFDPKEKPPLAALKKQSYLEQYGRPGADAGWHFLTGDKANIEALTQAVGFRYAYDAQKKLYNHGSGIMVLTPDGKLARYFYGISFSPRDLRLGLVDASAGQIGTPVEQVLLRCYYRYDGHTGKYTGSVLMLLRVVAAVVTLSLGVVLFGVWRRSRRSAAMAVSTTGA